MTPPEENCDNIGVDASTAGLKAEGDTPKLKTLTARSVKWNLIDKFSTQVLAAVTGIVLARILSEEDFGLVGAILVFQAFASLFVDSGFSFALIQRKAPTRLDYSTVLWFNMGMAVTVYPAACAFKPRYVPFVHPQCFGDSADQQADEKDGCAHGCRI